MFETRLRRTILGGLCLIVVVLAGSGTTDGVEIDATDATNAPFKSEASKRWKTPSDEECREFAKAFESAVASGDTKAMEEMFDWDAVLERATRGIKGVDRKRRQFIAGVKKGLKSRKGVGSQIVSSTRGDGSYRFLRVRLRNGRKRILFRMLISDNGGMNYHDMVVVKQPGGKVRIVDIYVYLTAEMISTTMRRIYIPIAASQNKSILEKLSGKEKDFVKHFKEFASMAAAVRSKQFRRATHIYGRLPKSLQKDKNVLILRLLASQEVSDEEYVKAIDAFRRHHPDDPCVDIISIGKSILDEKYDDALDAVGRIDKSVGGDPHLDVLRASLYMLKEDYSLAKKRVKRAIKVEPTLLEAYYVLADLSVAEMSFDETTRVLQMIEDKFDVEFKDLTSVPEYSEYVKSPQYQKWLNSRKKK